MRRAFTLVELLVVLSIIGLLIGLLLPALSAARRSARTTLCLNQTRQIGLATFLYAQDMRGYLPRSSHSALAHRVLPWGYQLPIYLGKERYDGPGQAWDTLFNGVYRCPEDPRRGDAWSYGKSVWFELRADEAGAIEGKPQAPTYLTLASVPRASATILYGELLLTNTSMADHIMAHYWYIGGYPEVDRRRHGQASNYIHVDGHARTRVFETTFDESAGLDLWHPGKAR